jgi:fibronectin-binding autotransporter adhesin
MNIPCVGPESSLVGSSVPQTFRSSSTLFRRSALAAAALFACLFLGLSAFAESQIIYRETFGRPPAPAPTGNLNPTNWGWTHFVTAGTPQNSGNGVNGTDNGNPVNVTNVNAGPNNDGTFVAYTNSYHYHDQNPNCLSFTPEFQFDPADYAPGSLVISWYMGNASQLHTVQVVVRIGTNWFLSAQVFTNITVTSAGGGFFTNCELQHFTFSTVRTNWIQFAFNGDYVISPFSRIASTLGPLTNNGAIATSDLSGTVTAWGLYSQQNGIGGNRRFDTITIEGDADQTPPKPVTWTGATSGIWDTTNINWVTASTPTNYHQRDLVTFDDTLAGNSTIALINTLKPTSLLINNSLSNYVFNGSGNLSGFAQLVKQGTGKLTIANTANNDYSGNTLISGGTLQIGNGDASGNLPTQSAVTNNGALVFNRSDNFSAAHAFFGTGSITKNGAGTLTLSGSSTATGPLVLNQGTLVFNAAFTNGSSLSNAVGTVLAGAGVNTGSAQLDGTLSPGSGTNLVAGTITVGSLTLDSGTGLIFDANTNNNVGGGTNDLVQVNGNLTVNNNTISVNLLQGRVQTGVPYRVANYTGTKSGSFNSTAVLPPTRYSAAISEATPNQINVTFTGAGPSQLLWNSAASSLWDIGTSSNWNNLSTLQNPDVFYSFDTVTFDDTAAQNNINLTTSLNPLGITVTNNTKTYVIGGTGKLTGVTGLTKNGTGLLIMDDSGGSDFSGRLAVNSGTVILARNNAMSGGVSIASNAVVQIGTNNGTGTFPTGASTNDGLVIFNRGVDLTVSAAIAGATNAAFIKTNAGILTLSGANTFTGVVSVVNGTLRAGNNSALGRTNGSTTIASGATLDVGGFNLGGETVIVSGTGVGGLGAIINSGAEQDNALRLVTLTGDTTFGGTGRWDIRESGTGLGDAVLRGAFNLTKISTNQVSLVGVDASALNNIAVQQGIFALQRGTFLSGSSTINVSSGAQLEFFNNSAAISSTLTLNGDGVTATMFQNGGSVNLNNNATLNGTVVFGGNGNNIIMSAAVSGAGASVLKTGSHQLTFSAGESWTGTTVISNGIVVFESPKTGGAGITVYTNGFIGGNNTIHENITVNAGGGFKPGNQFSVPTGVVTVDGNVTLNNSSNLFELSASTISGNDQLSVLGNLTMTGTNTLRIGTTDHLTAGDIYTVISYNTGSGIASNNIAVVPPPFGVTLSLIDPATTPGQIQIQVLQAIGFDFWDGNDPVHPTFWDVAVTTNWIRNGPTAFASNDFACFSDPRSPNPNSTNIILVGKVTAVATIFTNEFRAYQFTGSGSLSGGELILEGPNPVTIANSGSNDWTNGILIDANVEAEFFPASLYVGDGTANGNLGFGTITNDGILVFNHGGGYSNALVVGNNIVNGPDSGSLPFPVGIVYGVSNIGPGVVILSGSSTFTNEVDILNGTMAAGSTTAFGATGTNNAAVVVSSGATLDDNGQNLGAKVIVAGGAGVGSNGALVNNATNAQTSAFQWVTLTTNTWFGGSSRWDIRGGLATLATSPAGSPYNITKVGTNQIALVGVTTIDPAISNVDIQAGTFAIQTSTHQFGDARGTITVHSNANLNVWNLTDAPFNKKVVIQDGGAMWLENGTVTNLGSIVVSGSNTFNMAGTRLTLQSNSISGSGTLYKIGNGTLEFAGTNNFTGNIVISNGTVALIGNNSLAASAVIDMQSTNGTGGVIIDVTNRADGTLTIGTGQKLLGVGSVRGTLTVSSGATLAPGHSIGSIAGTTNITLGGQTLMDIDAGAVTNDQVITTNSITYGGTLVVTNINGTLAAGQSYRLFNAGTYSLNFSSVTLPTLTAPLYWTNTLTSNGTIAVASAVVPQPHITAITINPPNITISATNGSPGGTFYVLSSTNIALPLSNWTRIATNVFDGSGNIVGYTVTNATSGAQKFYILQLP